MPASPPAVPTCDASARQRHAEGAVGVTVQLGAKGEPAVAEQAQRQDGLLEAVCIVVVALRRRRGERGRSWQGQPAGAAQRRMARVLAPHPAPQAHLDALRPIMVHVQGNGVHIAWGQHCRLHERRLHALPHPGGRGRHVQPHAARHPGVRLCQLVARPGVPAWTRGRGRRAGSACSDRQHRHRQDLPQVRRPAKPQPTWPQRSTWCASGRRRAPRCGGSRHQEAAPRVHARPPHLRREVEAHGAAELGGQRGAPRCIPAQRVVRRVRLPPAASSMACSSSSLNRRVYVVTPTGSSPDGTGVAGASADPATGIGCWACVPAGGWLCAPTAALLLSPWPPASLSPQSCGT